jgi:hypothetical protein
MRFAHLKTHHRFERMRLRGLSGARDEFHLAAIVQNSRRLPAASGVCRPVRQLRAVRRRQLRWWFELRQAFVGSVGIPPPSKGGCDEESGGSPKKGRQRALAKLIAYFFNGIDPFQSCPTRNIALQRLP